MIRVRAALPFALALIAACDIAPPPPTAGAPRIIASSVAPGALGYAEHWLDAPLWVDFDRLLLPRTVSRVTVQFVSGESALTPRLRYDPAQRRVRVELDRAALRLDVEYELRVRQGIASWDGIASTESRAFRVRFVDRPAPVDPTPSLRRDVAPLLAANCGTSACHGGEHPAMRLDLSSAAAILRTAVGVESLEWPSPSGAVDRGEFGWAGFVRIARSEPAESYLVYKLLGDGPVRGAAMPRGAESLSEAEIRMVSAWIAAGAQDDPP